MDGCGGRAGRVGRWIGSRSHLIYVFRSAVLYRNEHQAAQLPNHHARTKLLERIWRGPRCAMATRAQSRRLCIACFVRNLRGNKERRLRRGLGETIYEGICGGVWMSRDSERARWVDGITQRASECPIRR